MPEYEPYIETPKNDKNAKVVLMTSESTHINGFFNWIFRISPQDPIRLLLVDNRKHGGLHSVTKTITVHRIRPHTGCRIKQPLYLIDSPDFGIEAEEYVARTYRALFQLITKIDGVPLRIVVVQIRKLSAQHSSNSLERTCRTTFWRSIIDSHVTVILFGGNHAKRELEMLNVLENQNHGRHEYDGEIKRRKKRTRGERQEY